MMSLQEKSKQKINVYKKINYEMGIEDAVVSLALACLILNLKEKKIYGNKLSESNLPIRIANNKKGDYSKIRSTIA
jgi:hypothetical protein